VWYWDESPAATFNLLMPRAADVHLSACLQCFYSINTSSYKGYWSMGTCDFSSIGIW